MMDVILRLNSGDLCCAVDWYSVDASMLAFSSWEIIGRLLHNGYLCIDVCLDFVRTCGAVVEDYDNTDVSCTIGYTHAFVEITLSSSFIFVVSVDTLRGTCSVGVTLFFNCVKKIG